MPRLCEIDACGRPVHGHDLCRLHYQRWVRSGDPNRARPYGNDDLGRLMSRVEYDPNGGCWFYSTLDDKGYGAFHVGQRSTKAHRESWRLHVGPIPAGLHVLHRCDVPACINPDHLFLGTHQENMDDRGRKGRTWSKIDRERETLVRRLREEGFSAAGIAKALDLSPQHVSAIGRGSRWRKPHPERAA